MRLEHLRQGMKPEEKVIFVLAKRRMVGLMLLQHGFLK